jgi:hypothetical protein
MATQGATVPLLLLAVRPTRASAEEEGVLATVAMEVVGEEPVPTLALSTQEALVRKAATEATLSQLQIPTTVTAVVAAEWVATVPPL